MGTARKDLSAMMQVYSLATWEIKKDKPSSGWFMYQNESEWDGRCRLKVDWRSLEDEDENEASKSPQSMVSTPDSPSASPSRFSFSAEGEGETPRTFPFSDSNDCRDCGEQIQTMAQSKSLKRG